MTAAAIDALTAEIRTLHPAEIDMSLARIERLLAALGNPERRLPPVFHVAGTNGKGSTVAFLRACLEAAGLRVHVFTSPHLVNFNERIRVAGKLIADDALLALFRDMLEVNAGQPLTIFEATTVLAFLAFSRTPADACVLEVGMGGRLDATNVVPDPAVCGIAQLGLDHTAFLGTTILQIAAEKAAIAKPGANLVLSRYAQAVTQRCAEVAGVAGARVVLRGADWEVARYGEAMHYRDASGRLELPLPRLLGAHQVDNAGLAIAMLRHQSRVAVPEAAIRAGIGWAEWPGRLQAIESGPLHAMLPPNARLTVDGAHNPASARVLADALSLFAERPITLILGVVGTKSAPEIVRAFAGKVARLYAVPVPGHECHEPVHLATMATEEGITAYPCGSVEEAFDRVAASPAHPPPHVVVAGSLYLAGDILRRSGLAPQ